MSDKLTAQLESIFAAVVAEVQSNPAFAQRILESISEQKKLKVRSLPPTRTPTQMPQPVTDLYAAYERGGEAELRSLMRSTSQKILYAWLKSSRLQKSGASKMNKTQLMEHIVRGIRDGLNPKPRFEY